LLPLVDATPPIHGVRGRPLLKPKVIYADRGYDSEPHRQRLHAKISSTPGYTDPGYPVEGRKTA
jgi:hypothetical protein